MKKRMWETILLLSAVIILLLFAGTDSGGSWKHGQIYLYGEAHGEKEILEKEFELWKAHYRQGMRHLFLEIPFYAAEYMNLWMQEPDDSLLHDLFSDWRGTSMQNYEVKKFYQRIKEECPGTVFHGTDVGHQISTGKRYLSYLESCGRKDTESYRRTQEVMEQGEFYRRTEDESYRERKLAENFIWEYEKIDPQNVMGIYGAAHTLAEGLNFEGTVPSMANQIRQIYGERVCAEDLSWMTKDIRPERVSVLEIDGKEYRAEYYGCYKIDFLEGYVYRRFWRLLDAEADFENVSRNGDWLPEREYPMLIGEGEILAIDYEKADGSVCRRLYLAAGKVETESGLKITEGIGKPTNAGQIPEE